MSEYEKGLVIGFWLGLVSGFFAVALVLADLILRNDSARWFDVAWMASGGVLAYIGGWFARRKWIPHER